MYCFCFLLELLLLLHEARATVAQVVNKQLPDLQGRGKQPPAKASGAGRLEISL